MTGAQRAFQAHAATWGAVNAFLFMIWLLTGAGHPWFLYPAGGWGIGLAAHAALVWNRPPRDDDADDDELPAGWTSGQLRSGPAATPDVAFGRDEDAPTYRTLD